MRFIKRLWLWLIPVLPFAAGAAAPLLIGGIAGVGVLAGFSIYRSMSPVDMADALSFFSSCWSCQMFSDVMAAMSNLIPKSYAAIGGAIIPIAVGLTAIWFAWTILSGYIGIKKPDEMNGWNIAGTFGTHMIKLAFVTALLVFPLPRLLTNVFIEPVFNVGLSLNRAVNSDLQVGTVNENQFEACLVATAIADPVAGSSVASNAGAFSPKLRHNLACQVSVVHQLTAIGMTSGWTMLNMAFNADYMHKILWDVPFFPNVPLFFAGLLILVLFFYALIQIPLYFLQVFIELSLDLIMLPLFLLSWLFDGWKIFPKGGDNIKGIIDRVIQNTLGIALVGIFVSFSVIFLNGIFGKFDGANTMLAAFESNDAKIFMDGLLMNNDSLIMIILLGLFIATFTSMITKLVPELFKGVKIPTEYYEAASKNIKTLRDNVLKWYRGLKKKE